MLHAYKFTTQAFGCTFGGSGRQFLNYFLVHPINELMVQVDPFVAADVEDVTHTGEGELTSTVSC